MNVLYVSKALVVAAYRDKIRELERHVAVRSIMPERWGREEPEPSPDGVVEPRRVAARLTGHNHLHHYVRPGRWLTDPRPDLVHVDEEPYSLVTLQLARLCRRHRIPFLFFAWQNVERRMPPPFGTVRQAVFRSADGGIGGTRRAAELLRGAGFDRPIAVIPQFGVDPGRFRPDPAARRATRARFRLPDDAFVVGYGGRLVPEKGVSILLEAFADMAVGERHDGRSHLLYLGDGPERDRLRTAAGHAGVADHVHLPGGIPSLDMPAHLAALDALVLPTVGTRSWAEQFGRILVEAMASGVPVVGTRNGEIADVVGDAGLLIPPGEPHAIGAALAELRDDGDLRSRLAEAGLQRARVRFTHACVARATVTFYRELVATRGDS